MGERKGRGGVGECERYNRGSMGDRRRGGECEREGRGVGERGGGGEVVLQVVGAGGVAPGAKICQEDRGKGAIEVE